MLNFISSQHVWLRICGNPTEHQRQYQRQQLIVADLMMATVN